MNYMLSFDYSALVQSGTATNTSITYDLGGADQTVAFTTAGVVSPWATETYVFTATSISTTLSIEGDYLGQWNGPLIDSVSVARTVLVPDNLIENGSFEATALGGVQQEAQSLPFECGEVGAHAQEFFFAFVRFVVGIEVESDHAYRAVPEVLWVYE